MNEQQEFSGNRHWITINGNNQITNGWAEHQAPDRPTKNAILYNDNAPSGGFRLIIDGVVQEEENPPLIDEWGVLLYSYINKKTIPRTPEEIEADRLKIEQSIQSTPTQEERIEAVEMFLTVLSKVLVEGGLINANAVPVMYRSEDK